MNVQRIVVGTDFSAPAEHAVATAVDLALSLGATVTVVHAYEMPAFGLPETTMASTAEVLEAIRSASRLAIEACAATYASRGVTVRPLLRMGAPWVEVNAVAAHDDADLVVVGSRGQRAFSKFLLGSVAERVLRSATCAVLVVPEEGDREMIAHAMSPVRRILVGCDFGEQSQHALDVALDLAAPLRAKVTVVHAWSIPTMLFPVDFPPPLIAFEREARDALAATVDGARSRDPAIQGVLRAGAPAREILAAAHEHAADLVILGTHGRKGLSRLFLGSVAESVARKSDIPVMIVSANEAKPTV